MYVQRPLYYHWITFPVNKKASQTLLMSEAFRSLGLRKHETMETNIEEIWKDVDGFDSYKINKSGTQVINKITGHIITYKPIKGGYLLVRINKNCIRYSFLVHRLVAFAFIPNPENKPFVCHRDNDPRNNASDNLYWGTCLENNLQCISEGRGRRLKGENNHHSIFTDLQVGVIKEALNQGHSLTTIGRYFKTSRGTIWKIKAGYAWRHV